MIKELQVEAQVFFVDKEFWQCLYGSKQYDPKTSTMPMIVPRKTRIQKKDHEGKKLQPAPAIEKGCRGDIVKRGGWGRW